MSRARTRITVNNFRIENFGNDSFCRKQRLSVNGDSGNGSQDEHDDDQERYSDKIERLKQKENEVRYFLLT